MVLVKIMSVQVRLWVVQVEIIVKPTMIVTLKFTFVVLVKMAGVKVVTALIYPVPLTAIVIITNKIYLKNRFFKIKGGEK